jgi:hypothetical protein
LKIAKVAKISQPLFTTIIVLYLFLQKQFGYILGEFFTNLSGHPVD